MKKIIISDVKIATDIKTDLMARTFSKSDIPLFKLRDLPRFGYEIYGIKKDNTEMVVFRLKLINATTKYPSMQIEYDENLLTVTR